MSQRGAPPVSQGKKRQKVIERENTNRAASHWTPSKKWGEKLKKFLGMVGESTGGDPLDKGGNPNRPTEKNKKG